MPLSWNEIKIRATAFAKEWASASDERAQAQEFWIAFFDIFGVRKPRVASFEHAVKKHQGKQGFIDLFWPGVLLIEHKSRGKSLERAHDQALDYFHGIKERDLPRYVLVSDFARLRLYDLEENAEPVEFALSDLPAHIKHFAFVAGYQAQDIRPQDPVNQKAAEKMGALHDALKASGYEGHPLEVLLVRLLFCLFADDTGIFEPPQAFRAWVEERTNPDGTDLGPQLGMLFQVLNTPEPKRSAKLDEQLASFRYINGGLFAETLPLAMFDADMREQLLECCALDWSRISPAIFGAMFQSIMDGKARRNLGAHYTSEENIQKLIKPLFLDELWNEFHRVKVNKTRLFEFHRSLRDLTFFDPACGCGNFLVITYRELRLLELEVLRVAYGNGQQQLDIQTLVAVDVDQFHGIEIEEFPAQIAQVAMWLIDHQMNQKIGDQFGKYFARIPLQKSPHIVHGNALQLDWAQVLPPERCTYVLGNPPFVGAKYMDDAQRADAQAVFSDVANGGLLDFVCAWYVKAAHYARASLAAGRTVETAPRVAFVSTNSITQGEQVGVLWGWLLAQGVHIHFAHRTFQWRNEAKGVAAVHCVIVGWGLNNPTDKTLFVYDDIKSEPHAIKVSNINPYLVDAQDIVLSRRSLPLCGAPMIGIGSQPIDDGNYLFTPEEKEEFLQREPQAAPYFHQWIGSDEFINGVERWTLWLGDCLPSDLRKMPLSLKRIDAVRKFRLSSKRKQTIAAAARPAHYGTEMIPAGDYIVIPKVSSERRNWVPVGFLSKDVFCSDLVFMIQNGDLFNFGVLTSTMHNAWVRAVCGRLKSDFRYSAAIVYNNYPWPNQTDAQRKAIETAAQAVLDARSLFPDATLADLYDPLTMPPELLKAHHKLDAAVDAAYGCKSGSFKNEAERVAFLFERYQQLASPLAPEPKTEKAKAKPRSRQKRPQAESGSGVAGS